MTEIGLDEVLELAKSLITDAVKSVAETEHGYYIQDSHAENFANEHFPKFCQLYLHVKDNRSRTEQWKEYVKDNFRQWIEKERQNGRA